MEFVTPVITPIIESLVVPLKRHFSFLVSSSNYVTDMHAKMTELNGTAHDMEKKKEGNEVNSLAVPHRVPVWLAEATTIKARAENVPTGGVGCLNMKMRYIAGKRSASIIDDIDRLINEKSKMEWTNEQIPLGKVSSKRPSISALVHEDDDDTDTQSIIKSSRDLIFNDALKSLESNDNRTRMIALCGMGGVGKTTMMEKLKEVVADRKMFDWVVKVAIGKNRNPIDIQKVVAEYIGHPLTETDKDARADRLQKRFQGMSKNGENRILVILDDVWETVNLKDIGLSSPLPNGFNLLLTSRDENVCNQMGVDSSLIFKIVVLTHPEATKLFWETTGIGSDSDIEPHLYQIGEDIIKRCCGLPIALKTIASSLKDNKEKDEWEDALSRLQNKRFDDYNIKAIFEISYNYLKEDDLKSIFLLSGLFPEDYNIDKEDILRYGWGLNFFRNVHTITKARSRTNTCVNKLIRSNLLIKSDREGCVKMHDLVRDFVLSNFSKVKQASIANNVSEQLKEEESYERILLKCEGMIKFPIDFYHPNLTLLKLMDGNKLLKFPADFYTKMKKLEVVAYRNMMHRPLLSQYPTTLRALCLHSCSLVDSNISFVGDLINLEVLSLAYCGIYKLPSKIGNLKRLKLLNLTGCSFLCIDDGVFQNLEMLEELYMQVSYKNTIRFTDTNCKELKMLSRKLSALDLEFLWNTVQPIDVSFENLERFRISIGCLLKSNKAGWENHDEYSFKNTLKLVIKSDELRKCGINKLFRKTEILCLEVKDINHLGDVSTHPPRHFLCNLKVLCISNCESLTYLFTASLAKGLTNLESLTIISCPVLKSVVNCENIATEVITFHKLQILFLDNLPLLVSLCDPVNAVELSQLLELHLYELPNITSIFAENNTNISSKQLFLNKEDVIPKLERLTIGRMKNLKEIWPSSNEEEVNNVYMIREIKVIDCNMLVNLFPCNPMRLLSYLERLTVEQCGSIEVLFNIDFGKIEQLTGICCLRSIRLLKCESFREVWKIKDAHDSFSDLVIRGFQAVEYIHIMYCKRFSYIVSPTTVNFDMRALEDISIQCGERKNESVKNSQEGEINSISKEEISKVGDAFTSFQIAYNFHQLRKIRFVRFKGVVVVFEMESPSNRDQLVKPQPPLLLLPNLKELELKLMDTMTHVWKCNNWNEFFILPKHQLHSSFQNLKSIKLKFCNNIKYLFSPLMVKLLSNLKEINITSCEHMEEVVSNRDDEETTSTSTHTTTAFFTHLDILDLSRMCTLKHIGGGVTNGTTNVSHGQSKLSEMDVVSWSLCRYPRVIRISSCHALSSVIPYLEAERIMEKLQVLSIERCKTLKEVFETIEVNNNNVGGCSSSTLVTIPRPTNSKMHKLPNLMILKIVNCKCLEYIFTFSMLESLNKLRKLTIRYCKAIKVIVREEYKGDTTTSIKGVVFPHLKSIEPAHLPNLEGFFLGVNIDFQWPILDYMKINDCPQMRALTSGLERQNGGGVPPSSEFPP